MEAEEGTVIHLQNTRLFLSISHMLYGEGISSHSLSACCPSWLVCTYIRSNCAYSSPNHLCVHYLPLWFGNFILTTAVSCSWRTNPLRRDSFCFQLLCSWKRLYPCHKQVESRFRNAKSRPKFLKNLLQAPEINEIQQFRPRLCLYWMDCLLCGAINL